MNQQQLQIYRVLDKADKLGKHGVFELLQKPFGEFGANLDARRAFLLTNFVFSTKDCSPDMEMVSMIESILDIILIMNMIQELEKNDEIWYR